MTTKKSILFILPLFLSACTDNGLLFRSSGDYRERSENIIYMVGEPYTIQDDVFTPQEDYTYIEEGEAYWYQTDDKSAVTQNGETNSADALTAMHRTLPLPSIVKITNLENNKTATVRVNDRGPMVKDRIIDVSEKTAQALGFNKDKTTKVLVEILPTESKALKQELLKKESDDVLKSAGALESYYKNDIPLVTAKENKNRNRNKNKKQEMPVAKDDDIIYSYKEHVKVTNLPPINGPVIQIGAFKNLASAQKIQQELAPFNPQIVQKNINGVTLNCVQISSFNSKQEAMMGLDKIKRSGYPEARLISK